jgi:hypothetical protein
MPETFFSRLFVLRLAYAGNGAAGLDHFRAEMFSDDLWGCWRSASTNLFEVMAAAQPSRRA